MGRSSRPRKPYRPKPVARPVMPAELDDIAVPAWLSLQMICEGKGEPMDYHTIAAFIATGDELAHRRPGTERQAIDEALPALHALRERWLRTQRLGFTGPELAAVRAAMHRTTELIGASTNFAAGDAFEAVVRQQQRLAADEARQELMP